MCRLPPRCVGQGVCRREFQTARRPRRVLQGVAHVPCKFDHYLRRVGKLAARTNSRCVERHGFSALRPHLPQRPRHQRTRDGLPPPQQWHKHPPQPPATSRPGCLAGSAEPGAAGARRASTAWTSSTPLGAVLAPHPDRCHAANPSRWGRHLGCA